MINNEGISYQTVLSRANRIQALYFAIMTRLYISLFIVLFSVSGPAATATNTFQYGSDVPRSQSNLLESDILLLDNIQFRELDPEFYKVTDIDRSLSRGSDLLGWLKERVRYVVGEKFVPYDKRYVERESYSFDLPQILPDFGSSDLMQVSPYQYSAAQIIMMNIGPVDYYLGKKAGKLYGLKISGVGKVPVSSPRVGIVQVGPGLFKVPKDGKATDYDVRMERLNTLLHEARHSDGRGVHLGMMHAKCPMGHPYSGYFACDFNLNGPYSVGAQMGKALTENCTDCTVAHKEKMRLSYLDSFSRVIKEKRKMPLDVEMAQRSACDQLKHLNLDIPMCEDLKRMDALNEEIPKAVYWDSQPEGRIEERKKSFWDFLF